MKRPIIILCYARSGGTILNKCFSSFSNAVVMSEVNPSGGGTGKTAEKSLRTIKSQSEAWYNIKLSSESFSDLAFELNSICTKINKHLIIRDWSIVDFEALKENNYKPKNKFSILEELKGLNPVVLGFVRNAIDVWISRGQPDPNLFFPAYHNYISALKSLNIPIFKYEDFTETPDYVLREMCKTMNLEYEHVLDMAASYDKVNGDIQRGKNSRGEQIGEIRPLKRQIIPLANVKSVNTNEHMKKANELMDYGVNYFDKVFFPTYLAKRLGQFYFRSKRKFS